jgi:molybdopterin converting factor small subunit
MLISTYPVKGVCRLATVRFTSALARFVTAPPAEVAGATVGEALAAVFEMRPALRGYVLDDQGALRRHVAVYVGGEAVRDRVRLSDPIRPNDDIYVFQALTGG